MTETGRIADQLARAFDGAAWHGPPLMAVLDGVAAEQAARKPVPSAHSIWEIAEHLIAWNAIPLRRLRGEAVEPTPAEDWPSITDTSDTAWADTLDRLRQRHHALHEAVLRFPAHRLDETTPGKTYSHYILLHGAVQHNLYHAGQIALLKKAG